LIPVLSVGVNVPPRLKVAPIACVTRIPPIDPIAPEGILKLPSKLKIRLLLFPVIWVFPFMVVVPFTVRVSPLVGKARMAVPLMVNVATVVVTFMFVVPLARITSSPIAGTPAGLHVPPVFQLPPLDVFTTAKTGLEAPSRATMEIKYLIFIK
jgi:hypothetical protein